MTTLVTRSPQPSRRWVLGMLLVAPIGYGVALWLSQLSPIERQFLGSWTTTEQFDGGSTCTRTWQVRSDRSLHYHNQYHWIAAQGRPARNEESHGVMNWSIRDGRLLLNPIHPAAKRLQVLWILTRWRVRNAMQGVSGIVMDSEGSNGRLSAVGPQTFTVNWWDPDKKRESTEVIYTRVTTGPQPSASE